MDIRQKIRRISWVVPMLVGLIIFNRSTLLGQANPEKHATGMSKIAFVEGTWGGDLYAKDAEGNFQKTGSVSPTDPDTSKLTSFQSLFDGNYYRLKGKFNGNFSMTLGYDQWRDIYVMICFEDGPGLIDIYQGNFNEKGDLVLSNFEAGTHFQKNGTKYYNRMVFGNITEKRFSWFIDQSIDGENWDRLTRYDLKK